MGRPKGTHKTGGRKKGTPNKTTKEIKPLLHSILNKEIENLPKLIKQLEPKERVDAITKLLPYIVPKMKQVDNIVSEIQEPLIVEVVYPEKSNIKIDGN